MPHKNNPRKRSGNFTVTSGPVAGSDFNRIKPSPFKPRRK
jgi:hypothetical protein